MQSRIQITQAQQRFIQSTARRVLFVGGIGAGKTHILCERGIHESMQGRPGVIIGMTYGSLRDVIVPKFLQRADAHGITASFRRGDMQLQVRGGASILLRSGDNPDGLRGPGYAWAGMDEAAYVSDEAYKVLLGRMREVKNAQMFFTTTPKGRGNWVYDLSTSPSCETIVQSTFGNPFLPDDYLVDLVDQYSSKFARQELYGEFVDMSGNLVSRDWFSVIEKNEVEDFLGGKPTRRCRFWDLATTAKTHKKGDYTVGLRLETRIKGGKRHCVVTDVDRFKEEWPSVRRRIISNAHKDGKNVTAVLEKVSMQKALFQDIRDNPAMAEYKVKDSYPKGDKIERAGLWMADAEYGRIAIVRADWNEEYLEELANMTGDNTHKHDDQWDATSGAHLFLAKSARPLTFGNMY